MTPLQRFLTRSFLVTGLGAGMAFVLPAASASAQEGSAATRQGRQGGQARGRHGGHGRHGHHGRHHGHGIQRALRQLDLTDNQRAQVRAIFESARERKRELRAGLRDEATRDATRAELRSLHQETRRLVMEVLTPEQQAKLAELREQRQARHVDRRVARMTETLSLSETQAARIRSILEAAQTQRQALRNGSEVGSERREAMQSLRQRTKAAIDAVLTAEQRATLEAHRAEHRDHRGRRGRPGRRGPGSAR